MSTELVSIAPPNSLLSCAVCRVESAVSARATVLKVFEAG